ncbi:MAG: tetratricopeptide repeat protein [Acidobacteria bacterium]|nr:tetratricopeptide repeat protein [Acidobacteriota bacterium]
MNKVAFRASIVCLGVLTVVSLPLLASYEEGLNAFKAKDYGRAIEEFSIEIEKHPNYDYGHFMLGMSYLKLKKVDKALPYLERAAEIDKEKLVYLYNLSQAYRQLGKWDKVIRTLEGKTELRARPKENANSHYLLGLAYVNAKRYPDAVDQLEAGKKLAAKDAKILSALGTAYFYTGDYDNAISNLKTAVASKPKDQVTNRFLSEALVAKAQRTADKPQKKQLYGEAVKFAEQAKNLNGKDDFATANLTGRACLGAERYPQAVEAFTKAISFKPKHPYAHYNKAEAYKGMKDWDSATAEYVKATELDPQHATFFAALGYAYEQLAKQPDNAGESLDDAKRCYENAQKIKPKTSTRDAIARVAQNIVIREDNRRTDEENTRIEELNLQREAEYAKQLEESAEYERRRQEYLEDKGIVQKKRRETSGETDKEPAPADAPAPVDAPEPADAGEVGDAPAPETGT